MRHCHLVRIYPEQLLVRARGRHPHHPFGDGVCIAFVLLSISVSKQIRSAAKPIWQIVPGSAKSWPYTLSAAERVHGTSSVLRGRPHEDIDVADRSGDAVRDQRMSAGQHGLHRRTQQTAKHVVPYMIS
jgi:hypothetical protein